MIFSRGYPCINWRDDSAVRYSMFLCFHRSIILSDIPMYRCLTETLLLEDYGVKATLLANRICPTVPSRMNYLAWLDELLQSESSRKRLKVDKDVSTPSSGHASLHILDIGVGSSAIYPLLGRAHFGWKFVGSDIDEEAVNHARCIVAENPSLSDDISLVKVSNSIALQERILSILNKFAIERDGQDDSRESSSKFASCASELLNLMSIECCCGDGVATPLRGPVRAACVASLDSTDGLRQSSLDAESAKEPCDHCTTRLFDACLTNPPFYDVDEKASVARDTCIMICVICYNARCRSLRVLIAYATDVMSKCQQLAERRHS